MKIYAIGNRVYRGIILHFFKQAEARLAARRQARAEAREIRMREIERQQKEAEENADKAFDMNVAGKYLAIINILCIFVSFYIFFFYNCILFF